MAKLKKKLSTEHKRVKKEAKAERQKKYMWVLMNGKQVRVKRPPTIDGILQDEWLAENADPITLHQCEMWDVLRAKENTGSQE